jgi:arylsulfatase A-like enzyme
MADRRILILAFDALRPDMVTPELMPNLTRFAASGVRFSNNRSTYPTETRVNQTALVTGASPARHGIVGNRFLDLEASPDRLFNTGDETELSAADKRLGGRLVDTPVMSEILAAAGLDLAVVSAGTPGGCRILNHKAEGQGAFRLALKRPDASVPADSVAAAIDRVGPIPEHRIPSIEWLTYTTDIYLKFIEPEQAPAVTILWYCEPDNSYHYKGIGTPDNLAAIRAVDAEFGRILAWREAEGLEDILQIVTLSDHGQVSVSSESLDVAGRLREAGFTVGDAVNGDQDAILSLSSAGGLYVRESDPQLIARMVQWLQKQSWCGPVFTRDGLGALSHEHVGIAHRRAPDIGFVVLSDDAANEVGLVGTSLQDSAYPVGGGLHGGLHHKELHNWLALGGSAFARGDVVARPSGIIDILPTVLSVLGVDIPETVEGRVLVEAFAGNVGSAPDPKVETYACEGVDGYRAHLTVSRVGTTRYLDRAWVTRD